MSYCLPEKWWGIALLLSAILLVSCSQGGGHKAGASTPAPVAKSATPTATADTTVSSSPSTASSALPSPAAPASPTATAETPAPAAFPPDVVARINGQSVTKDEYGRYLTTIAPKQLLDRYLDNLLLDLEAKKRQITIVPGELAARIDKEIKQIADQQFSGSLEQLEAILKQQGLSLAEYKERIREETQQQLLTEKMILQGFVPAESDMKKLFEEKFGPGGEKKRLLHFLIKTSSKYDAADLYPKTAYDSNLKNIQEETRKLADELLGKLQQGENFEELARKNSDDYTAPNGGLLKSTWSNRDFGPEWKNAVLNTPVGQLSPVVASSEGYHIIKVMKKDPADIRRVRHLLLRMPENPGAANDPKAQEQEKKLRDRLQELQDKLKAGADFAELAKANSDDWTKSRGGDLGTNWKDRAFGPAFDDAVARLQEKEVSHVIRSKDGFHLAQVTEILKYSIEPAHLYLSWRYEKVKRRKAKPVVDDKARATVASVLERVKKGEDFSKICKEISEDVATKDKDGELEPHWSERLGKELEKAADGLQEGQTSEILETPEGFHLLSLPEIVRTKMETVEDKLLEELKEKATGPAGKENFLSDLRKAAKIERPDQPPTPPEAEHEGGTALPEGAPVLPEEGMIQMEQPPEEMPIEMQPGEEYPMEEYPMEEPPMEEPPAVEVPEEPQGGTGGK